MKEFILAENWWQFLIIAVVCYWIGCFNFARVISVSKHRDITKIGSGNPGTMNMTREFGLKIGIITFFCDAFKGGVPAIISYFIYRNYAFAGTEIIVSDFTRYFCGLFVIIGHIFPATMRFKGGKGIASTLGLYWLCISCEKGWMLPIGFGFLIGIAFYIVWTEWGSMGSLIGVTGFAIWQGLIFYFRYGNNLSHPLVVVLFMLLFSITTITWVAHHKNIVRLLSGEEHHTSVKKMIKKKKNKQK